MKLVLDAKELAVALSLPITTIQQYSSKYPEKLPPRLTTPSRKLMWSVKDVEAWVDAHRPQLAPANVPD
jgi:hypothetical protein